MKNKPIIPITLSFIAGFLLYDYMELGLICIILLFAYVLFYKLYNINIKQIYPVLIFITIGILMNRNLNNLYLLKLDYKEIYLEGVVEDKVLNKSGNYNYLIYKTKINNEKYKKKILLRSYSQDENMDIGDAINGNIKFKVPKSNSNPKGFNYKKYLASKKIFGYADLKNNDFEIYPSEFKTLKIKRKFKDEINYLFDANLSEKNSRLMKTIFLNENYLTEDEIELHKNFGLSHVLAVSGLHIGIIYLSMMFILRILRLSKPKRAIISILLVFLYGYILGFPPSVLRVSIILTFNTLARFLRKPWEDKNTLFLSMFIILLINPMQIYSIGFQFSYMATFIIIIFDKKIEDLIENRVLKLICLNTIIYLSLLPITAYYFNEITLNFLIGAIFILPIYTIIVILGFLSIFFYLIKFSLMYNPLILLLNFVLNFLNNIFLGLHKFNFLKFNIKSFNIAGILLYYIVFCLVFLKYQNLKEMKFKKKLNFFKLVLFSNLLIYTVIYISNPVIINFIDIGQGDATLVRSLNDNILIDTGGEFFKEKDDTLTEYFRKIGLKRIDDVFITHFDYDHSGNLIYLKDLYEFNLYGKSEDYNMFLKDTKFELENIKFNDISKYKKINYKNFNIDILNNEYNNTDSNNNSVIYKLNINKESFLFTGDIEQEYEKKLINSKINIKSNVLNVPHHGSSTSSTFEFIKKVNPKYAIISVGKQNIYGHPDKEVLERYIKNNTRIYRTDINGNIKVLVDKFGYIIKPTIKKYRIIDLIDIRVILLLIQIYLGYVYLNNESKRNDVFEL